MKLLLTGSTGFIGSHLIQKLTELGISTTALIRPNTVTTRLDQLGVPYIVDTGDVAALHRDIKTYSFTGVVHLASLFLGTHSPEQAEQLIHSNVSFPTRLLEALKGTTVRWFLNTGTFWQHYNNEEYRAVNLYAASKQAFQDVLNYYADTLKIRVITLKLNDTYGPNDTRKKIIPLLLSQSGVSLLLSPGEQCLDFTYIDDIVNAYCHAITVLDTAESGYYDDVYAISSGQSYTLKQVVSLMEECLEKPIPVEWGATPYREREVMYPWTGGRVLPGWTPTISLKEGIKRIITL